MRQYLALCDATSIQCLIADREFIGVEWMDFLNNNNIPFVIRVKTNMTVTLDDGRIWSLATLLRRKRTRSVAAVWKAHLNGTAGRTQIQLSLAAKRLRTGELLIVATNRADPKQALNDYRKRQRIDCLFSDIKTRGLNLEDKRIISPEKLATLIAIAALAMVWAYRCATTKMGMKAVSRKTHGRREKSWFRIGLDTLRQWINHNPIKAIQAWSRTCPIRSLQTPERA